MPREIFVFWGQCAAIQSKKYFGSFVFSLWFCVAELLNRMGWEVRLTPYSGDDGRDIIAVSNLEPVPLLMLVECKCYAEHRPVSPDPITRLWYRLNVEKANLAMVVTTSHFQDVAKRVAQELSYQVALTEGTDFINWVRECRK